MSQRPGRQKRRIQVLGLLLLGGFVMSHLVVARGQSIIADQDVIGNGISLQALKDSHCDHLESQHADSESPLVCALTPGTRFVFVTSTGSLSGGDLVMWANSLPSLGSFNDGLVAADAICQYHANNARYPLPGTYKAWLSTDSVNAKDRIGDHRWITTSGTVIANDLADLLDCNNPGCLQSGISVTEDGRGLWAPVIGIPPPIVLTGTTPQGLRDADATTCNNWTSSASNLVTVLGDAGQSNDWWTKYLPPYSGSCEAGIMNLAFYGYRLYCFGN